ncbi:MAG: DNA repair protein RecO [Candidatus Saccharibacteria bacterium]|nr:DNA repair protein RecO [Candidatus Saccharibacteria bacterium]
MPSNDFKSEAIVLRRTNYGETDRIVNFLTPSGSKSALAKGARKEKSKLAGGIEVFCLSDITIHERSSDGLGILTSTKPKHFYENIVKDLETLEFASNILKSASKLSSAIESPDLFNLVKEIFEALDTKLLPINFIDIYYILNYAEISGEGINLISDSNGAKLDKDSKYFWDSFAKVFAKNDDGNFNASHIKLLRLIIAGNLKTISRVKDLDKYTSDFVVIANSFK